MGTNYYWKLDSDQRTPLGYRSLEQDPDRREYDPDIHLGKRSSAGTYCWDCNLTLAKGGLEAVRDARGGEHYNRCPECGKEPELRTLTARAVRLGAGLGSSEPLQARPHGASTTSIFSWAQDPGAVRAICARQPQDVLIYDEYATEFTGEEFLQILEYDCALDNLRSLGEEFS